MKQLIMLIFAGLSLALINPAFAQNQDNGVSHHVKKGIKKGAHGVKKGAVKGAEGVKKGAVKGVHGVKKGAEKAGHAVGDAGKAVGHGAKKTGTSVKDAIFESKSGPHGETVYKENDGRYYYIDEKGYHVYVLEGELKTK
jgi:hypothetical protein